MMNWFRPAIFLVALAFSITAQDTFSANSGTAPCPAGDQSEAAIHARMVAAVSQQRAAVEKDYENARAACKSNTACVTRVRKARDEGVQQNDAAVRTEDARHTQAMIDMRLECAGRPFKESVLAFDSVDILKHLIPEVKDSASVNSDLIAKQMFLSTAPIIRDLLFAEVRKTYARIQVLKGRINRLTTAERADLSDREEYFNRLRKTVDQLRETYRVIRENMGVTGTGFPRVEELNIVIE